MYCKMFEVFPRYLQEFAVEAHLNLNMPLDYMLGSILYAGAVAIGNTHEVRIKNGWNEGTNMFMAIVGETGASKSHPISLAIKPLLKKNQEYYKRYLDELKEYELQQKRSKKDDNISEHMEAPKLNQIIADDATLEAIYRMHNNNPRGLGIYFDELLGWFNNMGKYNKGSDQEAWLKIWSRKPILVNRVSSLPISLMLPNISVIGSVQTKLLIELFKQNRDKNGFVERILFIKPANTKKGEFPENDMPKSVLANYKRIIDRILDLPLHIDENAQITPVVLELTNGAKNLFKQHYNLNSSYEVV